MIIRDLLSACLLAGALGIATAGMAAPACVDPARDAGQALPEAPQRGVGGTGAPESGMGGTGSPAVGIGGTGAPLAGIGGTGAPESGLGGTGAPAAGIGGTGAVAAGIGGTGAVAAGIGGTGSPAGGIGGTGAVAGSGMGGTGIVGTITGFASICVNGLEVHYDDATPMSENGQPANARRLAVGQVVAIDAAPSARGLEAKQVVIMHALAGPVTRNDRGGLEVMGQPVRFVAGLDRQGSEGFGPGTPVRVSGLRGADGTVVASRVERADDLPEHSAVGETHRNSVDGLPIRGRELPAEGTQTLVRGHWSGRDLVARELVVNPGRPFGDRAERLVIEARVRQDDGRLRAGGFDLHLDDATRSDRADGLVAGELVRITGRPEGRNGLRADRIERPRRDDARGGPGRRGGGADDGAEDDRRGRGRDDDRDDDRGSGRDDRGSGRDDREDRSGRGGGSGSSGSDRPDRPDRSGSNSGRDDRPERLDRPERIDRIDRIERPERIETDRSGRSDASRARFRWQVHEPGIRVARYPSH